jgi:outer membrane protein OmpA-like peptidoglycan-associated protein
MAKLKPVIMKLLFLFILLFSGLGAMAQHNQYNWQLKGYTGVANYYNPDKKTSDYFKLEDNLWHRLEIGRSLGKTFGLSASASFGKIRGLGLQGSQFTTEARMTSLRLYFYTDNGWLLKESAIISPFFFGGYGLSTFNQGSNGALKESKYRQVLPFGLGLKFRLTDRWQLDLQTEAVYNTNPSLNAIATEQNKYNNGFLHTGLALAYNFGSKPSSFKAARFYASFQQPLGQPDTAQSITAPNLAKLNTRSTQLAAPAARPENPKLIVIRDTILVTETNNRQIKDTLSRQSLIRQKPDTFYRYRVDKSRATTRTNLVSPDTLRSTAQYKELKNREIALQEYNLRTKRAATLRQAEAARVQESSRTAVPYRAAPKSSTPVYSPAPNRYSNNRTPLNPASQNAWVQIDQDKNELEKANRENRQLQYAYDSLQTTLNQDKVLATPLKQNSSFSTLDSKLMRYMQEQAILNESMQQRLLDYENELTRSEPNEAPTSIPESPAISSFDSTVFFSKNSYEISSPNFNNLLACAAWLKENPEQKIQLTGYADKTGNPDYNLLLSRKRVEAVSKFLQFRGVEKERILMQYFGETNSVEPLISLDRKVILNLLD